MVLFLRLVMVKKIRIWFFFLFVLLFWFPCVYADQITYLYYYGATCIHCKVVDEYFDTTDIDESLAIQKKEVMENKDNNYELVQKVQQYHIPTDQVGTPFLLIERENGQHSWICGDSPIISYFKRVEQWENFDFQTIQPEENVIQWNSNEDELPDAENPWKFFLIMIPAALSDSINPCAFAVMLLLLTSILSKTENKKKALLSWILFSLAVFICYFLLGVGVLKLIGNFESLNILKWIVWIVWLLVALANLKDYFRYGKGFVMEIPHARRPALMKIVKKVVSPLGAFVIWIVVSLFLLPCSSGPYLTILGFLGSENQTLNEWGYLYLFVYNLIFILPMLVIAGLVGFGYSTAEKLGAFKNKNTKLIHLIVGILMLLLSAYVIGSMYF